MVMLFIEVMRLGRLDWETGLRFGYASIEIHVRQQYGHVRYKAELSL